MILTCAVVETGVAQFGRSLEVPCDEKSGMIELTMQWRLKVLSGWCMKSRCSFQ